MKIFPMKTFFSKVYKIIKVKNEITGKYKCFVLWNISYLVYFELYLLDSCQKFLLEITRKQFFRVIYCKKQLLWKSVVLMKGALFGNKNLLPIFTFTKFLIIIKTRSRPCSIHFKLMKISDQILLKVKIVLKENCCLTLSEVEKKSWNHTFLILLSSKFNTVKMLSKHNRVMKHFLSLSPKLSKIHSFENQQRFNCYWNCQKVTFLKNLQKLT